MSDDLISRSKYIEALGGMLEEARKELDSCTTEREFLIWRSYCDCIGLIKRSITNLPAVDAVPVVHGRWIRTCNIPMVNKFTCSVCGNDSLKGKYCPNCGAKMDCENDKETERFRMAEEFKKVMRTAEFWKRRREEVEREHNFCNGARKENDNV